MKARDLSEPWLPPAPWWRQGSDGTDFFVDLREKYERMLEVSTLPDDANRRALLRKISQRWPAALREAEMIGPTATAARLQLAQRICAGAVGVQEAGAAAIVWMGCVHVGLRSLQQFREEVELAQRNATGFALWLAARSETIDGWPRGSELASRLQAWAPKSRDLYLYYADLAHVSVPDFYYLLFCRHGRWQQT